MTETHAAEHMISWEIVRDDKESTLKEKNTPMDGWQDKGSKIGKMSNFLSESYTDLVTDDVIN